MIGPKQPTIKQAIDYCLRHEKMMMRWNPNYQEFRIMPVEDRGITERRTYFTNDLMDAIRTARAIRKWITP